jgi:hypothetical protein
VVAGVVPRIAAACTLPYSISFVFRIPKDIIIPHPAAAYAVADYGYNLAALRHESSHAAVPPTTCTSFGASIISQCSVLTKFEESQMVFLLSCVQRPAWPPGWVYRNSSSSSFVGRTHRTKMRMGVHVCGSLLLTDRHHY